MSPKLQIFLGLYIEDKDGYLFILFSEDVIVTPKKTVVKPWTSLEEGCVAFC
jgi:hypothetical protein